MKEPVTRTRRNYRRRICSQSSTGDDDDDKHEKDDDLGCDSNAGVEGESILKQQPRPAPSGAYKNVIAAAVVDEVVADSTGKSGKEDGLFVSSHGGGGSVDANFTHTAESEDGSGQMGARIASGIGFHMLRAMGWTENTGLGQLGKGMVDPILPTVKKGNLGIGFSAPSEYDTRQEAIRQVQKAKREERDRKLKLKVIILSRTGPIWNSFQLEIVRDIFAHAEKEQGMFYWTSNFNTERHGVPAAAHRHRHRKPPTLLKLPTSARNRFSKSKSFQIL